MPNNYWQSRFAELAYFIRNCCIRISKFVIVTLHYIILQLKVRTHNAIAPWSPLIATSGACHTFWLCFLTYRRRTLLRAFSGHLTSTLVCALLTQPCWWYRPRDVQHSVIMPSQWPRHVRGTACRRLSGMHCRWRHSVASWRLYFFGRRLTLIRRSWFYCTVQLLLTYLVDEHSAVPAPIAWTFKLSTIGGRAFPVAASQIWNSLPDTVVSASTLRSFQYQ